MDAGALTLQPLAGYDPDGRLVPRLAASIPTPENGGVAPDLRSITWKLRDGLRWSDGSALTADDVVFTWQYCVHPETGCTSRDYFAGVASVEAPDARTVVIRFAAPTPYPYAAFVGGRMPVISRAQFGGCLGAAARDCPSATTAPLGAGPYRIVEFTPDAAAVYERNPFYWGERPYYDRVVLRGGGEAAEAARAVLATGEADFGWNLQVEPETLAALEAAGLGRVTAGFGSQIERIVVNQTNPAPALGAARSEYRDGANPHPFLTFTPIPQALSLAVDRAAIAGLYGFAARPVCNLVAAPPDYASAANDECLAPDLDGAKRLLDAHGVTDNDGDGVREYRGVPLHLTFQTTANPLRQETQELLRGWWRQLGIETELLAHDAGVFFGGDPAVAEESYRRFLADLQMFTDGSGVDPQQALAAGLCRNIQSQANGWAGSNNARSCNAEYDALFAQLEQTPPGPERESLVQQLNDIAVQSYYQIPLVNRGLVSAHRHTLEGVRPNAWDSSLWNIAEWRRR